VEAAFSDLDHGRREGVERVTLRGIGWSFLALAGYVAIDSLTSLWCRARGGRDADRVVCLLVGNRRSAVRE